MLFYLMAKKSQAGSAPGLVDGKLAPLPAKPNCVSSEAGTEDRKRVAPIEDTSLKAMSAAIMDTGGLITDTTQSYLRAEYRTSLYKFVDDVEVRMDGKTAHIRSASRVGYSDRGVNRKRVEAIRAAALAAATK